MRHPNSPDDRSDCGTGVSFARQAPAASAAITIDGVDIHYVH
jgi:hypothetical protein